MNKIKLTIILTLFAALCTAAYGQVTVGSGNKPVNGALLDIKEKDEATGGVTATKGLLMPRVNLTNLTDIAADITGITPANKDAHTGLTVYNVNKCLDTGAGKGGPGVYVWSGTQWENLGKAQEIIGDILGLSSSLYGTTDASGNLRINIPSGLDARGTTISPFSLTVNSDPLASLGTITDTYNGGIAFSATPSWATGLLTANPTVYSGLQATDMSGLTGIATTQPWQTRQTVLNFTGKAGCPPANVVNRTVTLNQTNYALMATNSAGTPSTSNQTNLVVIRDASIIPAAVYIHGNTAWKAAPSTATAGDLTKVIKDDYSTSANEGSPYKGADNTANGKSATQFAFIKADGPYNNLKYATVDMVFSDTAVVTGKRAKDITVTFLQCQGTEDLPSAKTTADNNETSTTPAPAEWSGKVVQHEAKAGVYEEFYSAEFGTAGRWMTTNLVASAYDGVTHAAGRTITGPNANVSTTLNTAYWCYPGPNGSNGTNNSSYLVNPRIGLLYTWDAATAGKGLANGASNPIIQEGGLPETTTNEPGKQMRLQGICPSGWHLPSDYEWTELENAIIMNTSNYAYTTDIGGANLAFNDPASARGTRHGQAMLDVCGLEQNVNWGLSHLPREGGLAVLMPGYIERVAPNIDFGTIGGYWSSSSNAADNAWVREFRLNEAKVRKGLHNRGSMLSVRCKKN
ncbi:FISUMP domain-containing protein [Dysgonomonas sp.]